MTEDGETITLAAKTTFEISSLAVASDKVTLVVTVTVGNGQALPETIAPGGNLKIRVKEFLTADWAETPPAITNSNPDRVDPIHRG